MIFAATVNYIVKSVSEASIRRQLEQERNKPTVLQPQTEKPKKPQTVVEQERVQPSRPKPKMSMANYNRVREVMTYIQVISIVGERTEESASSEFGELRTVIYTWKVGLFGTNANMTFPNGKLVGKAQAGL